MTEHGRAGGRTGRIGAAFAAFAVAVFVLAGVGPARAQVPDLPSPPEVPQPVTDAIAQVNGTVMPALSNAAVTLSPVSNAAGFALRGPCAVIGTAAVVLALAGGVAPLPVSVGGYLVPVYILCAYTYDPGPADPYFEQIDDAVGPTVSEQAEPIYAQISDGIEPARPQLSTPCSALSLFETAPSYLPPPSNRAPVIAIICSGA